MDDEDYSESPYEWMGNKFDTEDTFHVNNDGRPDFAVVEKIGYINEATAAPDGFSPEQPSYWSFKSVVAQRVFGTVRQRQAVLSGSNPPFRLDAPLP